MVRINLEFRMADGSHALVYDVHPRSQEEGPIPVPPGTVSVVVWLGTRTHMLLPEETRDGTDP